jgi:eukaryotic-like serine/threonine-protein kinase
MDRFVDWLSHNPAAYIVVIVAFSVAVLTLTIVYTVAFFQGRAVSFWPPNIGSKPTSPLVKADNPSSQRRDIGIDSPMIIGKGAVLISSRGEAYSIESRTHSGSTAALFLASCGSGDKVVAKVYWRGLSPQSPAWESFQQEQQASEILRHRNIAKVLDRGIAGGYPFLIMEHFGGGSLRDWLNAHDRLPGRSILSISTQIADAIDFAHAQGVLHRDLKPDNILLESDATGRVAVSDFGIARLLGVIQRNITADIPIVGSIDYVAPEALRSEPLNRSADIYAFGVLVFEMIARRTPFDPQAEFSAVLLTKISEDAPEIRKFRDVPLGLSHRISASLNRNPQERPSSARGVLAGIENDLLTL